MIGFNTKVLAKAKQSGFTLVELIITITIFSTLSVGIWQFLASTTEAVIDTGERQRIANIGWVISEKISRNIRTALPNSVRINNDGSCVEYIPTKAGSVYLSAPINVVESDEVTTANFIDYNASTVESNDRLAIFPADNSSSYLLSSPSSISPTISSLSTNDAETTIGLSSNHQFSAHSPQRRVFVVQDPRRYCFVNNQLIESRAYGFNTAFEANVSPSYEAVVGSDIQNGLFAYNEGSFARNAVVSVSFDVVASNVKNDRQSITQEVQIRNVP